jgi:hypothetical protein
MVRARLTLRRTRTIEGLPVATASAHVQVTALRDRTAATHRAIRLETPRARIRSVIGQRIYNDSTWFYRDIARSDSTMSPPRPLSTAIRELCVREKRGGGHRGGEPSASMSWLSVDTNLRDWPCNLRCGRDQRRRPVFPV